MQRSDNPRQRENLSKYGEMNAPAPGQKKHRLSRFLGSNKDQQPETRPHVHSQPDSAYASDNTGNDIVQVENDGSIPNTKRDQHLALDRGTGEVFDEDTGEVVTVVTTTTTTTTTTTSRPGGQQRQDVQKDVQTTQHQQPHGAGTTTTTGSMAPHSHEPYRDSGYGSGLPTEGRIASGVPEHADPYKGGSYGAGSQHHSSTAPHIPARSPRRSGEYGRTGDYDSTSHPSGSYNPTSPSRHNFSYPSRAAPGAQGAYPTETGYPPEQEVKAKKTGRFADLKAAAIGLHGVGETLRGTLNSTIDDRLPRQNAEKAAAARAKNEAVLNRGRSEMSTISHRDSRGTLNQGYSAAPVSSNVTGYTHEPSYGHQTTTTGVPGTGHHESSYSHHTPATDVHGTSNEHRGHLPPDPNSNLRGNAHDGSHSAAFGLTPDGHRNTDTTAPTPMQSSQANLGTNDLSSVSGMGSSSSNTTVNTPGEKHHIPPRGTAVRGSSDYAPETISGNVEHVPTTQQSGHTDTSDTSHLNQSNTGHFGQSNTSHINHPNTGHTDTYNTSNLNQPTSSHLNQSNTGFTGTSNTGLTNQGNTGYTGTSNQGNTAYTGTSNTSHLNQANTGNTGASNTSHFNESNTGYTDTSNTSHLNNPNTGYTGTSNTGSANQGNTGHLNQSNTGYTGTSNTGNIDQSNESVSPVTRDDYASPNSAAEENNLKKTGTLGKLFKRKPVGGNTAQDTTTSSTSGPAKKYF